MRHISCFTTLPLVKMLLASLKCCILSGMYFQNWQKVLNRFYFTLLQRVSTATASHLQGLQVAMTDTSINHLALRPVVGFRLLSQVSPSSILSCFFPDSSVGIASRYGWDGPGIETRWWRGLLHPIRPIVEPPALPRPPG